jgi:hypothetical protein
LPNPPNVFVGMPCTYEVTTRWAMDMLGRLSYSASGIPRYTRAFRGFSLPDQRNLIVKTFLAKSVFTHLLWVDTDMIACTPSDPVDALSGLLKWDLPIVSGIYRLKKPGFPYSFLETKSAQNLTSDPFEVRAVGMGFCLIKKEVFEKITPPWYLSNPESSMGEDYYFCQLARENSFKIMVDPKIQLSHIGFLVIEPNGSVRPLDSD